ncbi:MAG: hypothetical protein C4523_18265 [Myxococcales bacterium]|nr:MAG: hypothetical protein C4523_18265 [Myxococcales bacterium]
MYYAETRMINDIAAALITLVLLAFFFGCGEEFEDKSQSLLMKAEILSVVLEPPEAEPGETVRASFLVSDQYGVLDAPLNLWVPAADSAVKGEVNPERGKDSLAVEDDLKRYGLDPEDLLSPVLVFTLPKDDQYQLNEAGQSPHKISLFVAVDEDATDPDALKQDLFGYVARGVLRLAYRTLIVSRRENRNHNPIIDSISVSGPDGAAREMKLVRHSDADLSAARLEAAADPFVTPAETELTISAKAHDPEQKAEELRYQWISTGGDFQGRRKMEQPFSAPEYDEGAGDGETNPDGRKDPNLHPVWLIVRDNGADDTLGQAWAEFYVRVTPPAINASE